MKRGKKIILNICKSLKISYGSVDTSDFKSVYVNIQSWITPKNDESNWPKIVGNFSRTIKHFILSKIDDSVLAKEFIVDLDLKSSGLSQNKKSFMNLEINFYPKPNVKFNDPKLKIIVESIINGINQDIVSKNQYFTFDSTK